MYSYSSVQHPEFLELYNMGGGGVGLIITPKNDSCNGEN
jgi:hypothetical protein